MNTLIACLMFVVVQAAPGVDFVSGIVDPYLRIQTALTNDAINEVGTDAKAIVTQAEKLGLSGGRIVAAAKELQRTQELKQVREAFGRLSDAIIAYADMSRTELGSDVKIASCPMIDKQWLQKGEKIGNPYDENMRGCGELKKLKRTGTKP